MAEGWFRNFEEPIPLPHGRTLRTPARLRRLHYQASQGRPCNTEWQAAMQAPMLVAEHNGPTMFARIGVMKALNRHVERVFNPDRKDHHWGKRKLARDR